MCPNVSEHSGGKCSGSKWTAMEGGVLVVAWLPVGAVAKVTTGFPVFGM